MSACTSCGHTAGHLDCARYALNKADRASDTLATQALELHRHILEQHSRASPLDAAAMNRVAQELLECAARCQRLLSQLLPEGSGMGASPL